MTRRGDLRIRAHRDGAAQLTAVVAAAGLDMVSVPAGEVPEAIARIARPLGGDGELEHLIELVASRQIVMIGEASHGTHEFYALRAALSRQLIAQHGFAAVAIEGDWPDALRVDRYVRGGGDDDSASDALADFQRFPTWMWRNAEVAELVEWLRIHNDQHPPEQRAGFYGLDLYSLHASAAAVISYLDEVDPEAAARARERYACFDHAGADPQHYGLQAHFGLEESCEEDVIAQLVEMQARHAARSGRAPTGEAWFHAIQNANVVRNAEQYYRTMFAGRGASWNLRDTHMADTLDMLANQLAGASAPPKLIVWAHNSHVGDARATEMGEDGQLTLGQLMRQRHPDQVALIGFTTDHGTVECAHDWDEPGIRERVRPSLPGSWEELFHGAGRPRFLVTATALREAVGSRAERLHRAIGVVYRPETERRSHYYHTRLAEQYDVVVHIDDTHAVHPLEPPMAAPMPPPDHEPPETFPSGI
jgi:erythromycin esterase-like protein